MKKLQFDAILTWLLASGTALLAVICLSTILLTENVYSQSDEVWTTAPARAQVCSSCSFGNKKTECAKCGKWMGSTQIPAILCSNCSFGNRKNDCVKCGKWVGSSGSPAYICGSCGFGSKKTNCVKCGKWAP